MRVSVMGTCWTIVFTLARLLALKGSVTGELQFALFKGVPTTVGWTTIVAVACALLPKVPRLKVTTWPTRVKALPGEADTKFTPGGRVSTSVTAVALAG